MYYYGKYNSRYKRKKYNSYRNKYNYKPADDIWDTYQMPKSYHEFDLKDEDYDFLSKHTDEEIAKLQERNNKLGNKESGLGCSATVLFIVFIILLKYCYNWPYCLILIGILIVITLLVSAAKKLKKKEVETHIWKLDDYKRYLYYLKEYKCKEQKYLNYVNELNGFKSNENEFICYAEKKLCAIQGRTYRSEKEWREMNDRQFEFEIGKVYSRLGYDVNVTRQSNDGGVDVIVKKDGKTTYIQCKHYGENTHLGAPELQSFWGCCSGDGISNGVMICTSNLTQAAWMFAGKLVGKLKIIGMGELMEMDKTFYKDHPINSKIVFNDSFKEYVAKNNLIDCNYAWLFPKIFYVEGEADNYIAKLKRWKDYSYIKKEKTIKLSKEIKVSIIILTPDYVKKDVENLSL